MNRRQQTDEVMVSGSIIGMNASPGPRVRMSQGAPDRHQATVAKHLSGIEVGTWNVRTLAQPGKLENVMREMDKMKLDALGLCEVRWIGVGRIKEGDKEIIYSGGDTHERGVGVLLKKNIAKSVLGYWAISDRVLIVKIKGSPFNINIIQVYAPTSACTEEE